MRYFYTTLLCLSQLMIAAQTTFNIGAIVESDSYIWALRTIEQYSDSLVVNWEIRSKAPNGLLPFNKDSVYLQEYNSSKTTHSAIRISCSKPDKLNSYYSDAIRITFPPTEDSLSIISIHLSSVVYIDSISLPYNYLGLVLENPQYKLPYCKKQLKDRKDSLAFSDSIFNEGMSLYYKEQYLEAITCFEKCHAFDKLLNREWLSSFVRWEYEDYSRIWLACSFYRAGYVDEAKELDGDYLLDPFDRKLTEKTDSIYNLISSNSYSPSSMKEKTEEYRKICKLDSATFGDKHHRYALVLYELGKQYLACRDFLSARDACQKAYNIITNLSKNNHLGKSILKTMATIAYNEEDYYLAIRYLEESIGVKDKEIDFSQDIPLISDYSTLSNYYSLSGNWERALEIERNKVLYWKAKYQKDKREEFNYVSALESYSSTLTNSGRHKDALRVYNRIAEFGPLNKSNLMRLGLLYFNLKDFHNALTCYLEALKDSSSIGDADLNQLAICYSSMGNYDKAIQIQKECISKADPKNYSFYFNNSYMNYTSYLSNLAYMFNICEQYDSALVYEKKSLKLKEKYYSPHNFNIAYSHLNMGISYGGEMKWSEAMDHLLFCYDIYKRQKERRFYHRALKYLTHYSFCFGNYQLMEKYLSEYVNSARQDLLSTFQELTYGERSKYIEEYNDLMNHKIPMYAYYTHSDTLISTAYNASLLMKGALLNSENSVKRIVQESKDISLKQLWEKLRTYRYILSKQQEKDSVRKRLNADSLQEVINHLEDTLIVKCKMYGDITKDLQRGWVDVQQSLKSNDIAIEFITFPISNDSVIYAALTVRKESKHPKMFILFEERQLKLLPDTLFYQCREMTELIWGPLLSELKGIKNIYFSATAALYNIGIEYLPGLDRFNLYRLSSTRELLTRNETESDKSAVLYGGLDYYARLGANNVKKSPFYCDELIDNADVRKMNLRGGMGLLSQTKVEVEKIGKELRKGNWSYIILTGSQGTEESLKSLSGKRINSLHISTHGFYYTTEEADILFYDFLNNNPSVSIEDKSLTRSGLIMAGANHILEGEELPENVEDGILTAKEIAEIDLRGLDLVVLSACQTGLGDITQGEGVFGLQRGFKKAGARTILMSLWEVSDEATQILMTQFYKNLLSGQSKRQSLQLAQNNLREYDHGKYNEPKYWAAFIMLDGLQ